MNEYLLKLIRQYEAANGLPNNSNFSLEYIREVKTWYESRKEISKKYVEYLYYLELNQQYANAAEVGKGRFDSIVLNNAKTTIISPYMNKNEEINNPFIPASFKVSDDGDAVFLFNCPSNLEKYSETTKLFLNTKEVIFMLNNPYCAMELNNWEKLTNQCKAEIIIGVYGNLHDKDLLVKMRMLKEFRTKITGLSILKYETEGDYYFNVLASNQLIKRLRNK